MAQEIRKLVIPGFKQLTNFFRTDSLLPAVYLLFNALFMFQILDARHKGKERTQVGAACDPVVYPAFLFVLRFRSKRAGSLVSQYLP